MKENVRKICDTAVLVALGVVLKLISDLIPFLNFFEGGTIDLAMLPIILIGFRNGYKHSFIGATVYFLICWMIGGFKIYSDMIFLEILLDRIIPYSIGYGISGLFYNIRSNRLKASLVIILCGLIRLISHTISGLVIWYSWTGFNEFAVMFYTSLIYNISYVGVTTIISVILFNAMFKIAYYKAD